ncbi:hypothetical protein ACFLQ5_00420 [Bacteroidota bacterium]
MRYLLSIDLNKNNQHAFSFQNFAIKEFLENENTFRPENYINLTTLTYERKSPGLVEKNWGMPFFNSENAFLFIAGSVFFRNNQKSEYPVPQPEEVYNIISKYGKDHYKVLKGNYYIVFLNKMNMSVEIYSSPMFMHPSFFIFQNNHVVFSNYIEAFKSYTSLSIDKQGLIEFSLFDHCINNRTIYNEIKSVQGGHLLKFSNHKFEDNLVYDITNWYTDKPLKKKVILSKINHSLKTTINNWIQNTDKFNVSLTGGFDGRLNFSFIDKTDYKKLQAISYGMEGSNQISIPTKISKKLNFKYTPVYLDSEFERMIPDLGMKSVSITCGITGFNRAMYPYAYNMTKDFSRSCLLGQCDMIRPMFNNPAGVIFNEFSKSVFFNDFEAFRNCAKNFAKNSFINSEEYEDDLLKKIFDDIYQLYVKPYNNFSTKLQFYFFLLKESLMKYWHTEFHLVDIFVDDFVSFADLDYLELLFSSEYAGIYKGLLAKNQFKRKSPHDLYIDLMSLNNNRLNYIYNDRNIKPGWLKYGKAGWAFSAVMKKIGDWQKRKENDTFDSKKWAEIFFSAYNKDIILEKSMFNSFRIKRFLENTDKGSDENYRFYRMISLKLWLTQFDLI